MRAAATGLLTGLLLAVAPASASALTCAQPSGPLQLLEHTPVSFVGQTIGHRDKLTVLRVQEAFRGVSPGQEVEVLLVSWGVSDHYLPPLGSPVTVVAGYGPDGILRTQLCMGASAEGLRAAAAARQEGRRCGSAVWSARSRSVRRRLTVRIAIRDLGAWAERVEVRWGDRRRTYPLAPAARTGASWRRLEVSRRFRLRGEVLVGISLVRSQLSRALCGMAPVPPAYAERTFWLPVR
jgi:hypothetical protein